MSSLWKQLVVAALLVAVNGDGKYWWMGKGSFGGGDGGGYQQQQQQDNSGGYQQSNSGFSQGSNNLPATQGLSSQGSCPVVNSIPPVAQCAGKVSDCWSVGQPDYDCIDNALCCFDGCANVCQGAGSRTPVQPPKPRPSQNQGVINTPVKPRRPAQKPKPKPKPQQKYKPKNKPWPQQQTKVVASKPKTTPQRRPQTQPKTMVQPRPQNKVAQGSCPAAANQSPAQCSGKVSDCWSVGQPDVDCIDNALCCFDGCANVCQGAGPRTAARPMSNVKQSQTAASKPFIKCPSAMKCVPKINCDFEGVMRNEVFNLTPEMEMLRVPLIPCINREAGNVIDVCCRDPNYKDPWPNMQGGGGGNSNQGQQPNIQINQRKNQQKNY